MAKMLINGEWRNAKSGKTYEVKNPANGQVVDSVPLGGTEEAEAAVEAAQAAFPGWAETSSQERADLLHKGVQSIKEEAKEIQALLTSEQGKPLFEAGGELQHFLHGLEFYVGLAGKI